MGTRAVGGVLVGGDATEAQVPGEACCCGIATTDHMHFLLLATTSDSTCTGCTNRHNNVSFNAGIPGPSSSGCWSTDVLCNVTLSDIEVNFGCTDTGTPKWQLIFNCGGTFYDTGWQDFDTLDCTTKTFQKDGIAGPGCTTCTWSLTWNKV